MFVFVSNLHKLSLYIILMSQHEAVIVYTNQKLLILASSQSYCNNMHLTFVSQHVLLTD